MYISLISKGICTAFRTTQHAYILHLSLCHCTYLLYTSTRNHNFLSVIFLPKFWKIYFLFSLRSFGSSMKVYILFTTYVWRCVKGVCAVMCLLAFCCLEDKFFFKWKEADVKILGVMILYILKLITCPGEMSLTKIK